MATKKSPINLLFFSPYFYPYVSGLTQYPYRLFTEGGLPLKVTCLTFLHEKHLAINEKIIDSMRIIRMPYIFRVSKGFISPQSLSVFFKRVRNADVVLLNLPSVEGLSLAILARIFNKPLIALLHCEVLLPFSFVNCLINTILTCGVFFQLLLAQKIIVYTKDYYADKPLYRLFMNKMEVLLPPVHTDLKRDVDFDLTLTQLRKEYAHVVGFCGRIAAEKGIEILLESVSHLKNTIIFFAGPTGKDVVGEEHYFKKIESELLIKKIPHVFLGVLSGSKLSSFYRSLDVLVLPSLNKTEAFGMVQVEAMLQGTPVVSSDLPGVRVPIRLTKMGLSVPPGKPFKLKEAIARILSKRHTFSNDDLVNRTRKMFDSQKTYDSIYSIVNKQLGNTL